MRFQRLMQLFGILMLGGAALAYAMKPTRVMGEQSGKINLEILVPQQFGSWRVDSDRAPIALPLELEDKQKEVYDQMLVRSYTGPQGQRIMLTIAYGGNQSRSLQVHRPEVCYAALGFNLLELRKTSLAGAPGSSPIPAMQMVAAQHTRNEPVTYWIRIGDQVVRGNLELGLARLSYGLRGFITDGLLFRVSNITSHNDQGFELQQRFVMDLFAALSAEDRRLLVGRLALPDHR